MKSMKDSILVDSSFTGCLIHGVRFIEYQPGNGTRYGVIFTDLDDLSAEAHDRIGSCGEKSVLVSIVAFDAYPMVVRKVGGTIHWSYVAEKMGIGTSDAFAIARLIGHVTGRDSVKECPCGIEV